MSDERENDAWRGLDRHRRPPRRPKPSTGTWRRQGCAVTAIGIAGALALGVARLRGLA